MAEEEADVGLALLPSLGTCAVASSQRGYRGSSIDERLAQIFAGQIPNDLIKPEDASNDF